MQKAKKRILISLAVVVCAWFVVGLTDYMLVLNDRKPVFCINDKYEYTGLGYKFEIYKRLSDARKHEYSYYIFGFLIESNVTNNYTTKDVEKCLQKE